MFLTAPVIAFERLLFTLRLTRGARFHFNHGGVIHGLLREALRQHELPAGVLPFACESSRVRFEANEAYRVGVTLVGDACRMREGLVAGLERVGADAARRSADGAPATLGGNFEVSQVKVLPPPDLDALTMALSRHERIVLRFVSPFRMTRPAELATEYARYLNGECFPGLHFLDRLSRRLLFLQHGRYPQLVELDDLRPPLPDDLPTDATGRMLWLDVPIEGRRVDRSRPKGHTLGGVLGSVTLDGVPSEWLPWLALGRYLHVGESTAYGFGRFVFDNDGADDGDEFKPTTSAAERLCDGTLLQAAWLHVSAKSDAAGIDGESSDMFSGDSGGNLRRLISHLSSGRYRSGPLLGILTRKHDARIRALTIPTIRDRIVQRAASELLAPAIDTLLEDCSYAYRKGFSRQGAARAIARAWDEGYRYVLDADVSAFFDSVDWRRLFAKLHALFPQDPIVAILKDWVRASVMFDGQRIDRDRGLPQGAPISPLLANLFLDEFDEELLGRDYRLVRYADDFVVLCRDPESAKQAHSDVQAALERLGLTLSEEKTRVVGPADSYGYLGYLFCGSVVLEKGASQPDLSAPLPNDAVPKASWLAQVPFERVKALAPGVGTREQTAVPVVALHDDLPADAPRKRPLHVMSPDVTLGLSGGTLRVERPGLPPDDLPLAAISHLVMYGRVRASLPLVIRLNEGGVPVYSCRHTGEVTAAFIPHAPDWGTWLAQGRYVEDPRARLSFVRAVVAAKLHNYAALVARFRLDGSAEVVRGIRRLEDDCEATEKIDAMVGLEGKGAALYFGALGRSLDPAWRFEGRKRHPPPDPINAMLSFGYTVLYHHVSTALVIHGLHPKIGVMHRGRGEHLALASDLMEEFRHLIDALVFATVRRGEIRVDGFRETGGVGPCLMSPEVRQGFVAKLEKRFLTTHSGRDETLSYLATIDRQARLFRETVIGRAPAYQPFRVGEAPERRKDGSVSPVSDGEQEGYGIS